MDSVKVKKGFFAGKLLKEPGDSIDQNEFDSLNEEEQAFLLANDFLDVELDAKVETELDVKTPEEFVPPIVPVEQAPAPTEPAPEVVVEQAVEAIPEQAADEVQADDEKQSKRKR